MSRPLGAIAEALGGELLGDPSLLISRLAPLATARKDEISFVAQARYENQIQTTCAGALIVPPTLRYAASARGSCILAEDPYLSFARLTQWWRAEHEPDEPAQIDATASIHPTAHIGAGVSIAAYAVIGPGASVGAGARIGPHAVLGRSAVVGDRTRLYARVSIGDRCVVGQRCILHPGVVVGACNPSYLGG